LLGDLGDGMKTLLGSLVGAALVAVSASAIAAPAAPPPSPAKVEAQAVDPVALGLAHQILAIGIPAEKRSQMFASVMDSITEQARKNAESLGLAKDKDFQAVLDHSQGRMWDELKPIANAALPDIYESMARAYARLFATDDLNALLAFVKTPPGQRFFERSPMILKDPDVQAAQQRMVAQMMTKLPDIMRENMKDIENYVATHKQPKAAEKTPVS
jgi:hypothetical protein